MLERELAVEEGAPFQDTFSGARCKGQIIRGRGDESAHGDKYLYGGS